MTISTHKIALKSIAEHRPLSEKITHVHEVIRQRYAEVKRVAVALYDEKSGLLRTFIHSTEGSNPLSRYQSHISEAPSLLAIKESGEVRVVNDLAIFARGKAEHTQKIGSKDYGSSYTLPMYYEGEFRGFIFFNANSRDFFDAESQHYLELHAHVLTMLISSELMAMRTLAAAVKTARDITHHRDNETGSHLDRMSRYCRIIAQELAPRYGLDDEFIEQLVLFSPLHDIGKIAIPDEILLKPGKLTDLEWQVMKSHTTKGREIIETLLDNFGLDAMYRVDMLHNIAEYHHEKIDGNGYPHGLRGNAIPLESRIVAVADVFDALTSARPYKEAWSNERAFELLKKMAGDELDRECVEALLIHNGEISEIQQRFAEKVLA